MIRVVVLLRDWIVYHFLGLYEFVGNLFVGWLLKLNIAFLFYVISHVSLPVLESIGDPAERG